MFLIVNKWIPTATELPNDGEIVIVEGGVAMFRGGEWFSGMEEPYFQRPIQWAVSHWAKHQTIADAACL